MIGGTANSLEEARRVWAMDVDYLGVGPVYGTTSKANPAQTMGLDNLAAIAAACPKPVIAIGSITAARIPDWHRWIRNKEAFAFGTTVAM